MIKSEQQGDGRGLVVGEKGKFEVQLIDPNQQQQRLQTRVSFLIVDSKVSLIEENQDPTLRIIKFQSYHWPLIPIMNQ